MPTPLENDDRLVVVSKSGPAKFVAQNGELLREDNGQWLALHASGGLPNTLSALTRHQRASWYSMALSEGDVLMARRGKTVSTKGQNVRLVEIPHDVQALGVENVANGFFWLTCHDLVRPGPIDTRSTHVFERILATREIAKRMAESDTWVRSWEAYRKFNHLMAEAVAADLIGEGVPDPVVLVQDFHLMLFGKRLRELLPEARLAHFQHVPYPSPRALALMPREHANELAEGLAAYNALGSHIPRWVQELDGIPGIETTTRYSLHLPSRYEGLLEEAGLTRTEEDRGRPCEVQAEIARLDDIWNGRKVIAILDRADLSKGILAGLTAYERFLDAHPEWVGEVVLAVFAENTRESLAEYKQLQQLIIERVDMINAKYPGAVELDPNPDIQISEVDLTERLKACFRRNHVRHLATLRSADVLWVNSIRDGENLTVKDFFKLNERNGAALVSVNAGVHDLLRDHVASAFPDDPDATAEALALVLAMSPAERIAARSGALEIIDSAPDSASCILFQIDAAKGLLPDDCPNVVAGSQLDRAGPGGTLTFGNLAIDGG